MAVRSLGARSELILHRDPAFARAREQGRQLPNRLRVLVELPHSIGILPAAPVTERDDVNRGVLIDEELVRNITFESAHVRPDLPRQAEAVGLRAGLEPCIP